VRHLSVTLDADYWSFLPTFHCSDELIAAFKNLINIRLVSLTITIGVFDEKYRKFCFQLELFAIAQLLKTKCLRISLESFVFKHWYFANHPNSQAILSTHESAAEVLHKSGARCLRIQHPEKGSFAAKQHVFSNIETLCLDQNFYDSCIRISSARFPDYDFEALLRTMPNLQHLFIRRRLDEVFWVQYYFADEEGESEYWRQLLPLSLSIRIPVTYCCTFSKNLPTANEILAGMMKITDEYPLATFWKNDQGDVILKQHKITIIHHMSAKRLFSADYLCACERDGQFVVSGDSPTLSQKCHCHYT
jgi:hypothetical protein